MSCTLEILVVARIESLCNVARRRPVMRVVRLDVLGDRLQNDRFRALQRFIGLCTSATRGSPKTIHDIYK